MENNLIPLGIGIILLGFILVFAGALTSANSKDAKVAVGGFIGFIPFGFGNDKNLVWFVTILSLALFGVWLLFSFRIFRGS